MDSEKVIEQSKRLSESMLWQLQEKAYCHFGPEAWRKKGVPSYLTCAPYTAHAYAKMTIGYLRDCLKPDAATPIDPKQPIYIFDLGAGTGRFGYLFINELKQQLLPLGNLKFCYVMTDIAEKNLAYLQQHTYLQPFIQEGILDFTFYHHEQKEPLKLLQSGKIVDSENPLIVIANYFFDTVPQDLFRSKQGSIEEGRIRITLPTCSDNVKLDNPEIIPHLTFEYNYVPFDNLEEYYSEFPEMKSLFQYYAENFPDVPFLIPKGAFETVNYFDRLSRGRLLLLAGDQGIGSLAQSTDTQEPKISKHGTFSIPVNYQAIVHFFRQKRGMGWLSTLPDTDFVVSASVLGGNRKQFLESDAAFNNTLGNFAPSDYWRLINCTSEWKNPSVEYILLMIKLGNGDPMVFHEWLPNIQASLPKLSPEWRHQLKVAIYQVWDHFYPISEEEGMFIMNLGVILYDMHDYQEALLFLKRALEVSGEVPALMQNISLCQQAISKEG